MEKKIKLFAMWLGGFFIGFGLCLCLMNLPTKNALWMNPDTGYVVWTNKAPSGEYVSISKTIDEYR